MLTIQNIRVWTVLAYTRPNYDDVDIEMIHDITLQASPCFASRDDAIKHAGTIWEEELTPILEDTGDLNHRVRTSIEKGEWELEGADGDPYIFIKVEELEIFPPGHTNPPPKNRPEPSAEIVDEVFNGIFVTLARNAQEPKDKPLNHIAKEIFEAIRPYIISPQPPTPGENNKQ